MKILQINTWYAEGSTGKLVESLHKGYLSYGFDSYVIYGRGNHKGVKNVVKGSYTLESKICSVLSRLTGVMYGGCYFSTKRILKLIKNINPDVIHIHCINSFVLNNYKFFKYIGKKNIKVVFTIHAEYPYTGSCSHSFGCNQWINGCKKCPRVKFASRSILFDNTSLSWKKMKKAVSYVKPENMTVISVSGWLSCNAQQSSILKDYRHLVIHNGIDKTIFRKYPSIENKFNYLRTDNTYFCLYLAPTFLTKEGNIKGGDYFLKLIDIFKNDKSVKFIVAGDNKYSYDFSKHKNVIYVGKITNQTELAHLYSFADLTLMISRGETFSLVTAESLCCGTPVLGFKSGGPESISEKNESLFFEQKDFDSLSNAIKNRLLKKTNGTESFDHNKMVEQYIKVVSDVAQGK